MYNNKNLAYNLPLSEEIKRQKKKNVVRFPRKEVLRRQLKAQIITIGLVAGSILAAIGAVAFFIHGQVKLTELTEQTTRLSNELKESESTYTQLAIKRESNHSLDKMATRARDELGMSKVDSSRIEYINVMGSDKGEVKAENKNLFEKIKDMFLGLMS